MDLELLCVAGLGLAFMADTLRMVCPDIVVQLNSHSHVHNYPRLDDRFVTDTPGWLHIQVSHNFPFVMNQHITKNRSLSEQIFMPVLYLGFYRNLLCTLFKFSVIFLRYKYILHRETHSNEKNQF